VNSKTNSICSSVYLSILFSFSASSAQLFIIIILANSSLNSFLLSSQSFKSSKEYFSKGKSEFFIFEAVFFIKNKI
jgi:hypothetical protein